MIAIGRAASSVAEVFLSKVDSITNFKQHHHHVTASARPSMHNFSVPVVSVFYIVFARSVISRPSVLCVDAKIRELYLVQWVKQGRMRFNHYGLPLSLEQTEWSNTEMTYTGILHDK